MSDDLISKRNEFMVYILNNASNKLPMKLSDLKFLGTPKDALKVIHPTAVALKDNYGIILEEVVDSKSGRKFICYAENATKSLQELDERQKRETTFLFIVLSYIFMSGGKVYDDQLVNFLNGLEISLNEEHSYFGSNLKKLLMETFVKQLYLKKRKCESDLEVEAKNILEWGFRAEKEFQKMKVLEVTAKIMNKPPKFFQTQFAEAEQNLNPQNNDVEMV